MNSRTLDSFFVALLLSFVLACPPAAADFVRGDTNGDAEIDLADALEILSWSFRDGEEPGCLDAADADDDGAITMNDAVFTLGYVLTDGAAPPAPFPGCGLDPTEDELGCGESIAHACPDTSPERNRKLRNVNTDGPGEGSGSGGGILADFNGDGYTDLAIGVPGEDDRKLVDVGAVNVLFGSANGLTSARNVFLSPGDAAGDHAGAAVAAGDIDGDGNADLVVGIPGANDDAGKVKVLYGPSFTEVQEVEQGSGGIKGEATPGDAFGSALAVGDFDGDGFMDVAIGAPGDEIEGEAGVGAVNVIYGSVAGLSAVDQLLDSVGGGFGTALAAGDLNGDSFTDLAVGTPFAFDGAGYVNVFLGSHERFRFGSYLYQGQVAALASERGDHFGFALAIGDFDGDGFFDLAIGIPDEDVGVFRKKVDAGAVQVYYGSVEGVDQHSRNERWHQDRSGVVDVVEEGDRFGFALAAGDFDGDGYADLAVGVPFEKFSKLSNPGAVNVLYGSGSGFTGRSQVLHQNRPGILGGAEADDRFGSSLATGNYDGDRYDDLVIGVPGEDIGTLKDAGAVNVVYGWFAGLTATDDQIWHQNSAGIAGRSDGGDRFGGGL